MGAQGKKTAPAGPTRRKVLVTALATAAGVAGARILGLRNLDASESLSTAMDATDMSMATGMAEPADEYDAMIGVPDDSYVGAQDLDPSYLPPSQPATLPPVDVRPAVMLQPPISGIAAPKLAGDVDWISPLAKESAKVTHLLRRATFGATDTELDRALSEGFARTVERLIETPFVEPPAFPARRRRDPRRRPRCRRTRAHQRARVRVPPQDRAPLQLRRPRRHRRRRRLRWRPPDRAPLRRRAWVRPLRVRARPCRR